LFNIFNFLLKKTDFAIIPALDRVNFFNFIYSKINRRLVFFKKKNYLSLGATLYVLTVFLPLLPSGSFFVSFGATIFWINFSFMVSNFNE